MTLLVFIVVSDCEMSGGSSICSELAEVLSEQVPDSKDDVAADPTFKSSTAVVLRSSPVQTRSCSSAVCVKEEVNHAAEAKNTAKSEG